MLLPTINGDVVMTARPELVRAIFANSAPTYGPFAAAGLAVLTGPRSLFQLRDQEHRRHRRLIMPPFHGSRMRTYADAMQQTTRRVFDEAVGRGPVMLHTLTQRISLEVILHTVFGVQQPEQVEKFSKSIAALVQAISPAFIYMPFLQRTLGGLGPYDRFLREFERFDALLVEQLQQARGHDESDDILHLLLAARDEEGNALDDQEIRDELRTLLFAGHETTGIALCWAIDSIGRHAKSATRLLDELNALGPDIDPVALSGVPYLQATCNETLRLYPIVTEVLRTLHTPIELDRYSLKPPTGVSASIVGVHRREELYPEPHTFRPERFMERRFGPHEFIPFGGGHRRCIGAAFAAFEMQIVLGTVLREYNIRLQNPYAPRPVRRNVTLAPRGGVPVTITRSQPGVIPIAA